MSRAGLRALYRSMTSQMKNSMARSMMRFVVLFQPVIFATIAFFMFRNSAIPDYGEYVVTGSGLITLWMTILWSSATDIDRERFMGTLEVLLISPVPFPLILLGKILGNTVLGILGLLLSYVYSTGVLGVTVPVVSSLHVGLALAVVVFSFVGFALMLALTFTLSRQANLIANGLSFPVYLLSGLFFPIASLPDWARLLGLTMPLSWAKETLRWATVGDAAAGQLWTPSYWAALGGLAAMGLLYFMVAHWLFQYVLEKKLRQLGQLRVA